MNKAALLTLVLVFSSVSMLVEFSRSVEASGLVYIRADGSIDPPTANITTIDDVTYTLTGNINEPIVIQRNDIVIDGAGYVIQGGGDLNSKGIDLNGRSNVTIRNMEIKGFYYGVYLLSSLNNTVSNNHVMNNFDGIYLVRSSGNTISGNNVTNNENGILFNYSSDNFLQGNLLDGNEYGLGFLGLELNHFLHLIETSNLVNGKPVYYLISRRDLSINSSTHPEVGFLALIDSTNITVEGLTLVNNRQGLLIAYTDNTRIQNNNVTNNLRGIWLDNSSNNTIFRNRVVMNLAGISLDNSSSNTISKNNITTNIDGIVVTRSSSNIVCKNTITNNFNGTRLYKTSDSHIYENDIAENINLGIHLVESSSNTISGNNITRNTKGIVLEESSNNRIYHNNLVDNMQQASIEIASYSNFWNEDYPSGGNYWSDYEERYPDATELDSSGIWNTPYIVDENNNDRYPLMNQYLDTTPPTISMISPENKTYPVNDVPLTFTLSEQALWIGYSLDEQANVTIYGNMTLSGLSDDSHSLTVYAKDRVENTGASEKIYFTVDTKKEEPFPTWIMVSIVIIVVVGAALLVYFKKFKKAK